MNRVAILTDGLLLGNAPSVLQHAAVSVLFVRYNLTILFRQYKLSKQYFSFQGRNIVGPLRD